MIKKTTVLSLSLLCIVPASGMWSNFKWLTKSAHAASNNEEIKARDLRTQITESFFQLGTLKKRNTFAPEINQCIATIEYGARNAAAMAVGSTLAVQKKLHSLTAELHALKQSAMQTIQPMNGSEFTAYVKQQEQQCTEIKNKFETLRQAYLQEITNFASWCYTHSMQERPVLHRGWFSSNKKRIFGFQEGTFKLEDANGKLWEFLTGYLDIVKNIVGDDHMGSDRSTSAANGYAYYRRQSHGFSQAFGIDLDEKNPLLGCFKHLLIGRDAKTGYIWIKPESHGLGGADLLGHATSFVAAQARKHLPWGAGDDLPEWSKERVPTDVKKAFFAAFGEKKSFMDYITTNKKTAELEKIAKAGIGSMYHYALVNMGVNQERAAFVETIKQQYEHPIVRQGCEIIIRQNDFRTSGPRVHAPNRYSSVA